MYRVDRNNFYAREKNATVFTPDPVSRFLYDVLSPEIGKGKGTIIDPCVGAGSLLKPWMEDGYDVLGIDIVDQGFPRTRVKNYLEVRRGEIKGKASLVVMNPPFNIDATTREYIKRHYGGRPLLPEIWLAKAIELFGDRVPMAMFTPYGFRLNLTEKSRRWAKFLSREYPPITSIISLPKDVFENVLFHSEVLIFNLPRLKGHYFVNAPLHEHQRPTAAQHAAARAEERRIQV